MIEPRGAIANARDALNLEELGLELHSRIRELYPICRSITGNGVRQTLQQLSTEIALQVQEIPTGTAVFDWTVPKEWNIRDAYIKNSDGVKIVDFNASNLHVVNYSTPVHTRMTLAALRPHLYSIPEYPDWIPYKTSYYKETWGFCLPDRQLVSLREDEYEVCIDSSLEAGHLTLGQCVLPGETSDEILFSSHICHPSLCNDNLSGVSVATSLARLLASLRRRYTYRFLFIPGTIGAIAWLALHEKDARRIKHGLVLACVGDRGGVSYKRSRSGNALIDRAVVHVIRRAGGEPAITDFSPYGYDERQYCSPGFNLSVGVLSRTPYAKFAEYHTSADNLEFVDPASLANTLTACLDVLEVLEGEAVYLNQNPKCEPQLGKRGLYGSMGGHVGKREMEEALLWVLNMSDGDHSLLDIAERSELPFTVVGSATDRLIQHGLIKEVPGSGQNEDPR